MDATTERSGGVVGRQRSRADEEGGEDDDEDEVQKNVAVVKRHR
jgi:hypothetical protein